MEFFEEAALPPRTEVRGFRAAKLMKLGELPALYPFARMAMSEEEELALLLNTLGVKNLTNIDKARDILKWMSTKEGK